MTNFTTTNTALCFSFASTEWREIIVEQETLFTLIKDIINLFLVIFGTQCDRSQRLSFTTSEDSGSVRAWQITNFAPDRTDFRCGTAIKAFAFIKDATTHCVTFYIRIVT